MSASNVKKKRVSEREATSAFERKEAAKKKKEKLKWVIGGIAIAVFVVIVLFLDSGFYNRITTALVVDNTQVGALSLDSGKQKYSVAEVNYVFYTQYNQYNQLYSNYLGSSISLDDVYNTDEDGNEVTWGDYFLEYSKQQLLEMTAMCAYAKANGMTLDDEDYAAIDDEISQIEETAKSNGWSNANGLLSAYYGKGCTTNVVRSMMELQTLAGKAQDVVTGDLTYTAEELAEKYATLADDYDKFTYDVYYIEAETVESEEEDGTAAATEETLAAAAAKAAEVIAKLDEGTALNDALAEVIGDVETTSYDEDGNAVTDTAPAAATANEALAGSSVESEISGWLKDSARAADEYTQIDGAAGSYIVVFHERDNNQAPTEESGDMNYCDYVAQQTLLSEVYSAWYSDTFSPAIEESYASAATYGFKFVGA